MILDALANAPRYAGMHPGFARAFAFLDATDMTALAPGRHHLDGDNLFVLVADNEGRGEDAARIEVHRRYIDIQYTIQGDELLGWMPLARCAQPDGVFDDTRDILFFADRPSTFVAVPAGSFAIFFPHDAHAPLAGRGRVKKAVIKVAVDFGR